MGVINVSGKNAMLDNLGTLCTYMALYTDVSATTEVSGAPYVRKPITWSPASAGSKSVSGSVVFDVPAGVTVRSVGVCTALTGGTQHALDDVTAETWGGVGTYTVSSFTVSIT